MRSLHLIRRRSCGHVSYAFWIYGCACSAKLWRESGKSAPYCCLLCSDEHVVPIKYVFVLFFIPSCWYKILHYLCFCRAFSVKTTWLLSNLLGEPLMILKYGGIALQHYFCNLRWKMGTAVFIFSFCWEVKFIIASWVWKLILIHYRRSGPHPEEPLFVPCILGRDLYFRFARLNSSSIQSIDLYSSTLLLMKS